MGTSGPSDSLSTMSELIPLSRPPLNYKRIAAVREYALQRPEGAIGSLVFLAVVSHSLKDAKRYDINNLIT
jgi:hypothetical protein